MRKFISVILLFCLLACGCSRKDTQEGIALPFGAADIESVDAYYYLENFSDSGRKKTVTDSGNIEYLYTTFRSLSLREDSADPDQYGANISAYRFHLSDGRTYLVVYEGYGIKDGILTTEDMDSYFTTADINGVWTNLTVDAEGCPAGELPVPCREAPASETTAPRVYTGEEAEVHQRVMDFFAVKQLDFFSEEDHSFAEYFLPELRETLDQQLYSKVFRFEKLVRRDILDDLTEEKLNAVITDITVTGDTAYVTAYEGYGYLLKSANGVESGRVISFAFTCEKTDGQWLISHIETDNELIEGVVDGLEDVDEYFG